MKNKNLILKIILSIIALGLIVTSFIIISEKEKAKDNGVIIVELIDIDNKVISNKEINFKKGDNLLNLLEENYDLKYDSYIYGAYITKIGELDVTNNNEYFIRIDIDGVVSDRGVSQIKLVNNMKITFSLIKIGEYL
jgi:hypothetical protein